MSIGEPAKNTIAAASTAAGTIAMWAQNTDLTSLGAQITTLSIAAGGSIYLIGQGAIRVWAYYLTVKLDNDDQREKRLGTSFSRKLEDITGQLGEVTAQLNDVKDDRRLVAEKLAESNVAVAKLQQENHDLLARMAGTIQETKSEAKAASRKVETLARKIDAGKIVIVEDDEATSKAMMRIIKAAGYTVEFAQTLEAARAILAIGPTWVVTDIGLPDGSGWDLVRHIREKHPAIKIAVCSAFDRADPEFLRQCSERRPELVLHKPDIDMDALFAAFARPSPAHPTASELDMPTLSASAAAKASSDAIPAVRPAPGATP